MGQLEYNLDLDFGPLPEVAIEQAFELHDFSCAAALLKAGVPLNESGIGLQNLVMGLEEGKPLDPGAAGVLVKAIYKTFSKEDINDLPFAQNAVFSMCRQGLNEAIGKVDGFAGMAAGLLLQATEEGSDKDVADTVLEAFRLDLLDASRLNDLDLFFQQLKSFDPLEKSFPALARNVAEHCIAPFGIWEERVKANSYSYPALQDIRILTWLLSEKVTSAGSFREHLSAAINPDLDAGCILFDAIEVSQRFWTSYENQSFQVFAEGFIKDHLSIDELSEMVGTEDHLDLLQSFGVKKKDLNKSLFKPSLLAAMLETDLGL